MEPDLTSTADAEPFVRKRGGRRKTVALAEVLPAGVVDDGRDHTVVMDEVIAPGQENMAPARFEVTLSGLKPLVVEALDEAEAWEAFKAHYGILDSDHRPAITTVTDGQ